MKINWKALIISLAIPLGVGALAAFLTRDSMAIYAEVTKPPLSPPGILFPIVWIILYTLMGISSYLVYMSDSKNERKAVSLYGVQLAVNFIWPLLFFNLQMYLAAFIWLLLLWVLVLFMIFAFYRERPISAYLQIPYIIWLTFAAYLNFGVFMLN